MLDPLCLLSEWILQSPMEPRIVSISQMWEGNLKPIHLTVCNESVTVNPSEYWNPDLIPKSLWHTTSKIPNEDSFTPQQTFIMCPLEVDGHHTVKQVIIHQLTQAVLVASAFPWGPSHSVFYQNPVGFDFLLADIIIYNVLLFQFHLTVFFTSLPFLGPFSLQ